MKWFDEFRAQGLDVRLLLTEAESLEDAEEYVRRRKLPFPILHDPKGVNSKALDLGGVPRALLLDATGKVIWQGRIGPADQAEADSCETAIRQEIERRKRGRTLPPR